MTLLTLALRPARAPLLLALTGTLVVGSVIPAATAVALAFLISRPTVAAVVPLAAVLLLGYGAEALIVPLEFLARARIDGRHRYDLARRAATTPTIDPLEDPAVQGLIRLARADPEHGPATTPADGALAQLRFGIGLLGVAASGLVLARYAWWLVPIVLAPAVVRWYVGARRHITAVGAWAYATKEELHANVWREATVSPSEGKDIRVFGLVDWMVRRMQHHIAVGNAPFWTYIDRMVRGEWIRFLLVLAGLVPAYVVVTLGAVRGSTTVAVQAAVLAAGWSLYRMLGTSDELYQMAGTAEVLRATRKLRAVLPPAPDHALAPSTSERPPLVRCEGLRFRYPGTDRVILDGVDLQIEPGELLAIVGLNGAGKSTLIKLLAGLYQPTQGRITADGRDIADIGPTAWRARIAVVFQDFVRYHLSAADNVALGKARNPADPVALDAAARDAGLNEVLARLPDGWRTPLARTRPGGVDLSGGQWQQVALARALYAVRQGARILVLDEPTAHLDVRTEFDVFGRLGAHRGSTSVVLISHRLSTVRQADRIVLLAGGRITESGSHDELMALGGAYADLFRIQAERFARGFDDRIEEGDLP
jgi:ATP-binding cassette subfamily B protein